VNIKRHRDRLDVLLTKYEQEIRETEARLRALKSKRNGVNLMLNESAPPATLPSEPEKFRDPGVTRSVLEAITDFWPLRKGAVTLTED
jgi:hypothetical protein